MKNKKILTMFMAIIMLLFITACGDKNLQTKNGEKLIIKKAETKEMQYENYNNGLISLQIPKGWKVEVPTVDYIHYTFKMYNPENPDYMFIFGLKQEGFLMDHSPHKDERKA